MGVEDRRIVAAGRLHEAIAEARHHSGEAGRVAVDVDAAAHVHRHHAQIVEAVQLVGMVVRDEHGIERGDARVDELLAHVGRGVDKHGRRAAGRLALHENASNGADGSSDSPDRRRPNSPRRPVRRCAARRRKSRSPGW